MNQQRWAQIEELFHRVAECDPSQRAALLDDACNGDAELRREVQALLAFEANAHDHVQDAIQTEIAGFGYSLTAGEVVSHYRILGELGGGGMGLVYLAEDIKLGRRVALKFLPEESIKDPAALARFEREARAASALEHPNICPIYEFGEHEGQPFLVMQLLEGRTLRQLLEERRIAGPESNLRGKSGDARALPLNQVLDIVIQIADGLNAAHQKGIIHRDIKPANVFVTSQGEVKILDFGLAKVATNDRGTTKVPKHHESSNGTVPQTVPTATPDPFLSRAGVAMGTAGYMSPEQARGEHLDIRTDLFSFGLVLYEMATGHRAFAGDTGPVLHAAILGQEPTPVRELNPELPIKFENIISKALAKNREQRYQNTPEMRTDLEVLMREIAPRNQFRRWMFAVGAIAALSAVGTILWFVRHASSSQTLPNIRLQQLTYNSPENPVNSGMISPDERYLAYADTKGIHIKVTGSGEVQNVPPAEGSKNGSTIWDFTSLPWFPDSKRFFVDGHPSSEPPDQWSELTSSIWLVSVLGGPPRKLRDQAMAWDVSPDGSWIAFTTNSLRREGFQSEKEIWLMAADGSQAHKLFESDPNTGVCCLHFFPEEHRLGYIISDNSGDTFVTRDLNGGPVTTLFTSSEMKSIGDSVWLRGGKFVYSDRCDPAGIRADASCNFWVSRIDVRTGKIIEAPRRLTNWFGFAIFGPSASADGKRVAFLETRALGVSHVADIAMDGRQLVNLRRVMLEESRDDAVRDWTQDGKTLIVEHVRDDHHFQISKQSLNGNMPESVVTIGEGFAERAIVSPDGKWIILQVSPTKADPVLPKTIRRVMRVPIVGGTPEPIFTVREGAWTLCARPPSSLCVVAEATEDMKDMTVTAFDPVKGRGSELTRFSLDEPPFLGELLCGLSPDGSRLAVSRSPRGPIEIHSLQGQQTITIPTTALDPLGYIKWAADGKGLFVSTHRPGAREILYLDLRGKPTVIWKCNQPWSCAVNPSPDGRHLAIHEVEQEANIFVMENF